MGKSIFSQADIDRITEALRKAPELLERLIGGGWAMGSLLGEREAEIEHYVTLLPQEALDPRIECGGVGGPAAGPLVPPPGPGWRMDQIIAPMVLWARAKPACSAPIAFASGGKVTAEDLWSWHRAILMGRPTGGPALCEKLEDCPMSAQTVHWGLALILAGLLGQEVPPVPPGVSVDEANRILGLAGRIVAQRKGA